MLLDKELERMDDKLNLLASNVDLMAYEIQSLYSRVAEIGHKLDLGMQENFNTLRKKELKKELKKESEKESWGLGSQYL